MLPEQGKARPEKPDGTGHNEYGETEAETLHASVAAGADGENPAGARLSARHTLKGRMQRHVLQVLLDHQDDDELPTNGRFVFYELEGKVIVRKSNRGESRRGNTVDPREQEVTDALSFVRDQGIVPWSWIVDETRTLHMWPHADTVAEYVTAAAREARLNPWWDEPPLILAESRSLGGVLRRLAAEYVCPVAATNGQVGGFLHTEIVPILRGNDRPVLYLGDWDHQGHQIEANTRRVLEREAGREIGWTRIAITEEQIAERGLTPVVKKDSRYKPPREFEAWETEALGQTTVVGLVREALDALLPEPLDDVLEREASERDSVTQVLDEYGPGDAGTPAT